MVDNQVLGSFVGPNSGMLFNILHLDGCRMMRVSERSSRMKAINKDLKVVNDLVERCIKDIRTELAKDL